MTPKEKAIELYNKLYNTSSHPHHIESRQQIAKECALIAVDEIIKSVPISPLELSHPAFYWKEVKQEIANL
jgi:hypothetical protein